MSKFLKWHVLETLINQISNSMSTFREYFQFYYDKLQLICAYMYKIYLKCWQLTSYACYKV